MDSKTGEVLTKHTLHTAEFHSKSHLKLQMLSDKTFKYIGVLSFDYSTCNLGLNHSNNLFKQVTLTNLKCHLTGKCDPYIKVMLGQSSYKTQHLSETTTKDYEFTNDRVTLEADGDNNRMVFVIFDKRLLKDSIVGAAETSVRSLPPTPTTLPILNH